MRHWGKNVQLFYIYIAYYLANKLLRNYRHLTCNVTKLDSNGRVHSSLPSYSFYMEKSICIPFYVFSWVPKN